VSQQTTNRSFDELTRGLASGSISRGRALRLMGAALVGGTLASLGIGEAAADEMCKPTGKKFNKNSQCCSDNCSRSGTSRFGTCAAACVPDFGEAGCLADTECCSGACVHEFGPTERGTCFPCHCPNETSLCRCRPRADGTGTVCIDDSGVTAPLPFPVLSCADCPEPLVCHVRPLGNLRCGTPC
jgi:hypothetical protein